MNRISYIILRNNVVEVFSKLVEVEARSGRRNTKQETGVPAESSETPPTS